MPRDNYHEPPPMSERPPDPPPAPPEPPAPAPTSSEVLGDKILGAVKLMTWVLYAYLVAGVAGLVVVLGIKAGWVWGLVAFPLGAITLLITLGAIWLVGDERGASFRLPEPRLRRGGWRPEGPSHARPKNPPQGQGHRA